MINFCWNYICIIEMYWSCIFHKKISSSRFRFWVILINIIIFYGQFRVSYHHTLWKCTQYDFVFYLNLQFWQISDKMYYSGYVIQFLLCLVLFQMKNMTSERKNLCCEREHIYCNISFYETLRSKIESL